MRHKISKHTFGRKQGPLTALIRGLVDSLVEHGRIRTTTTKAKELRKFVEKAVTKGKKGDVHARRVLLSNYPNKKTVETIMSDIAPRMKDRPGGYTRIIKLGPRPGDQADMSFIEFVDYELPDIDSDAVKGDEDAAKKAKAHARKVDQYKKRKRKIQADSRRINRPTK